MSRFLFPLGFLVFNLSYWFYFLSFLQVLIFIPQKDGLSLFNFNLLVKTVLSSIFNSKFKFLELSKY